MTETIEIVLAAEPLTSSLDDLRFYAKTYGIPVSPEDTEQSLREKLVTVIVPKLTEEEKDHRILKLDLFFHSPDNFGQ